MVEIDAAGWDARFTFLCELMPTDVAGVPDAADVLAEQHPREAMMTAVAWASLGPEMGAPLVEWNPTDPDVWREYTPPADEYAQVSGALMRALIPLLGVQAFEYGIPMPVDDDRVIDVIRGRFEMLWRLHFAVENGATVDEAMESLSEDGFLTPDAAPEWRVAQPPYWEAL